VSDDALPEAAPPAGPAVARGRWIAARALIAIEESAIALEDALASLLPPRGGAPDPDRDLAWFLAFGVCRARGRVDGALRQHLTRPLASVDLAVRAALRIGAFERLFARTPDHAAVDQAVELAKALGVGRAHGMVNAVLRKVAPGGDLTRGEQLDHPAWLGERWERRYGAEATEAWCRANGELPPLFLVQLGAPPADGVPVTLRGRRLPNVYEIPPGDPSAREGFGERAWVQDAGAVFFADLVGAGPGERVLDACAAPGGKTMRLASQGATVVAADRDRKRIDLIGATAKRLGFENVETRLVDWQKSDASEWGNFDAVLVDAPCSGLGTVRRHPEIRWRRNERDLLGASKNQLAILASAARRVRPGGRLVYAVCSPEPEEGRDVVQAFLGAHEDFELVEKHVLAPPERGEDAHAGALLRKRK
jgi:16S rRNA (cytosine967-C5)-methyltransferase